MDLLKDRRLILIICCVIFIIKTYPVAGFIGCLGPIYSFCHKVEGPHTKIRETKVYTVHECRDKCDQDQCIAFQYSAHTSSPQQGCKLFFGSSLQAILVPDSCTDDYWTYSWHREEYMKRIQRYCPIPKGKIFRYSLSSSSLDMRL